MREDESGRGRETQRGWGMSDNRLSVGWRAVLLLSAMRKGCCGENEKGVPIVVPLRSLLLRYVCVARGATDVCHLEVR